MVGRQLQLHKVDQRQLSRAVGSDQGHDVILGQAQRNVIKGLVGAKRLADMQSTQQVRFALLGAGRLFCNLLAPWFGVLLHVFRGKHLALAAEEGCVALDPDDEEQHRNLDDEVEHRTTEGIYGSGRRWPAIPAPDLHRIKQENEGAKHISDGHEEVDSKRDAEGHAVHLRCIGVARANLSPLARQPPSWVPQRDTHRERNQGSRIHDHADAKYGQKCLQRPRRKVRNDVSKEYGGQSVQGQNRHHGADRPVPCVELCSHDCRCSKRDKQGKHEVEEAVSDPEGTAADPVGILERPHLVGLLHGWIEDKGCRVDSMHQSEEDGVEDCRSGAGLRPVSFRGSQPEGRHLSPGELERTLLAST